MACYRNSDTLDYHMTCFCLRLISVGKKTSHPRGGEERAKKSPCFTCTVFCVPDQHSRHIFHISEWKSFAVRDWKFDYCHIALLITMTKEEEVCVASRGGGGSGRKRIRGRVGGRMDGKGC